MRDFGPDLFAGTAMYYAKYRPKYPRTFFNDVIKIFGLDGHGKMLDLGCGTGELSIPLAKHFDNVLSIDPEPGMLEQARLKAKHAKAGNIEWRSGSSRDLTGVEGLFKLVTLGQSFHWMDTKTVLNQLYERIEKGGGLCIVGSPGDCQPVQNKATAAKNQAIEHLVTIYLGPKRRAGRTTYVPTGQNWEKDLFPKTKFSGFKKRKYITKAKRNVDQELGNLYSMSWARRAYFGSDLERFETEFRRQLLELSPSGQFENKIAFEAYFLTKN